MKASTIVGYKKFTSKKGTDCNVLILLTDFSPAENARGNYGKAATEVFLNDDIAEKITPEHIGKQCELTYSIGSGGRAYLEDVTIVGK